MTQKTRLALLACVLTVGCLSCQSPESAESGKASSDNQTQAKESAEPTGEKNAADQHHDRHHGFDNPEQYAEEWNAEARDEWQKPDKVIQYMAIDTGDTVADLGTGTGYFLPHLSRVVGPSGRVLALDVSQEMLDYIDKNIRPKLPHDNVKTQLVPRDNPQLDPGSVDSVLTVNTWHHVKDRVAYARQIFGALKPGGTFVDVDYTKQTPEGPPKSIKLTPEQVQQELRNAGFKTRIADDSLPKQYIVIGTKPADPDAGTAESGADD